MAEFKQIIDDALDILKFDGAVQDTLAELREKWGAQVPALLDERFDAVGVQYMKLCAVFAGAWEVGFHHKNRFGSHPLLP